MCKFFTFINWFFYISYFCPWIPASIKDTFYSSGFLHHSLFNLTLQTLEVSIFGSLCIDSPPLPPFFSILLFSPGSLDVYTPLLLIVLIVDECCDYQVQRKPGSMVYKNIHLFNQLMEVFSFLEVSTGNNDSLDSKFPSHLNILITYS